MSENSVVNEQCATFRHPTRKKVALPPPPPTPLSLGNQEKDLLRYMSRLPSDVRFNTKKYHRDTGIPRSSIRDMLTKFILKELAEKKCTGSYLLTIQGKTAAELSEGGGGSSRREWRETTNLSMHYTRFTMPISKLQTDKNRLLKLNPIKYKAISLNNWVQHIIYFQDATIIISNNQAAIRIHDIVSEDTEESTYQSMMKAISYAEKLEGIGIEGQGIQLEPAHYARIKSLLADSLKKIDERYYIELGNGRKFWIDCSGGKLEDETNAPDVRQRWDGFFKDVLTSSNSNMSDVDKLKEIAKMQLQFHSLELYDKYLQIRDKLPQSGPQAPPLEKKEKEERAYFG